MITIITPINKIQFLKNAIDNYNRQLHLESELLLILNGDIINNNYKIPSYIRTIIVPDKNKTLGFIRNYGLEWMKNNNRKIYSWFDSDDYYGQNYLSEAIKKLEEGFDIVGKLDYRFKINDDIYFVKNLVKGNLVHAPTMTGNLNNLRFPDVHLSEDNIFISQHKNIGFTSSDNFIYNVRDDSVQQRSSISFLEGIKFYNSMTKNIMCEIYKNDELFWSYGMGFDFEKLKN